MGVFNVAYMADCLKSASLIRKGENGIGVVSEGDGKSVVLNRGFFLSYAISVCVTLSQSLPLLDTDTVFSIFDSWASMIKDLPKQVVT